MEKKTCPKCGQECKSNNIFKYVMYIDNRSFEYGGCHQYYCCGKSFEGPVVDIADLTACDLYDYND